MNSCQDKDILQKLYETNKKQQQIIKNLQQQIKERCKNYLLYASTNKIRLAQRKQQKQLIQNQHNKSIKLKNKQTKADFKNNTYYGKNDKKGKIYIVNVLNIKIGVKSQCQVTSMLAQNNSQLQKIEQKLSFYQSFIEKMFNTLFLQKKEQNNFLLYSYEQKINQIIQILNQKMQQNVKGIQSIAILQSESVSNLSKNIENLQKNSWHTPSSKNEQQNQNSAQKIFYHPVQLNDFNKIDNENVNSTNFKSLCKSSSYYQNNTNQISHQLILDTPKRQIKVKYVQHLEQPYFVQEDLPTAENLYVKRSFIRKKIVKRNLSVSSIKQSIKNKVSTKSFNSFEKQSLSQKNKSNSVKKEMSRQEKIEALKKSIKQMRISEVSEPRDSNYQKKIETLRQI